MTDNQTLPPPQGPEYARCFGCGHIEPEHRPGTGPCLVCACAAYRAVPVVPVLSPRPDQTADRAAVLLWAADALPEADLPFVPPMDRRRVANWLRRLAAEVQQPFESTPDCHTGPKAAPKAAEARQPDTTHSCSNCEGVDPDTCLMNPNRPPEQCPRSEFDGYGLQCQKPAGHNLCTFEEQPSPVHKGGNADDCPGPGTRP